MRPQVLSNFPMDFEGTNLDRTEEISAHTQTATEVTEPSASSNDNTEEIAKELLAIVCKNGGTINMTNVMGSLSEVGILYLSKHGIYPILQSSFSDILKLEYDPSNNTATLKVKVEIDICKNYSNQECVLEEECPNLHVCPQFVRGNCAFGEDGVCNLNHNFSCEHEQGILRKFKLDCLHEGSLVLLLQNIILGLSDEIISSTEVCSYYNSVQGCPTGFSCVMLHLCGAFTKGECLNRADTCTRSHDVPTEKCRLTESLKRHQQQLVASRVINFKNLLGFARKAALTQASPPTIDEICGFHLKGNCQYGRLCKKYWSNLPYLWQITVTLEDDSEKWINFPPVYNETIEYDYCDVNMVTSIDINFGRDGNASLRICLDEMVAKAQTGN